MPDYQQMYLKLFNRVTDIIEELRQIQQETEDIYLQSEEPRLMALKNDEGAKRGN